MEKILVSACLLGNKCTYKGGDNAQSYFEELNTFCDLIPFCCEVEGGLGVPRLPSEIRGNAILDSEGKDVSSAFRLGVYKASSIVSYLGIRYAILKENSPSCGVHFVHDGYFSGRLVKGEGLLTRELKRLGVTVMNEEEGLAFLEHLKKEKAIKDEKTTAAIEKENAPSPEPKKEEPRRPYGEKKGYRLDKKPFHKQGEKRFDSKSAKHFDKKAGFKGKKPFAKGEKKTDYGVRKPASFNRNRRKNFKKDQAKKSVPSSSESFEDFSSRLASALSTASNPSPTTMIPSPSNPHSAKRMMLSLLAWSSVFITKDITPSTKNAIPTRIPT